MGKIAEPVDALEALTGAPKLHIFPCGWACFVALEPQ